MSFIRSGPKRPKLVSKVRRTYTQAYTEDWASVSAACIERAGHRCQDCGCKSTPDNRLRAHHVIQVARGGVTTGYMLRCVCDRCHKRKPGHKHLNR